jgi:hypothetical protein
MATHPVTRRSFLRGAGVTLALPLLESMVPRGFSAEVTSAPPRRMVCINATLGLHAENLFPRETGRDYQLTPYLEVIQEFRDEFTIFSGLSHPEVDGGHTADASFLTAAPHPSGSSFKNTISLDQLAAERLLPDTRFTSLQLNSLPSGRSPSYTRGGAMIPAYARPSVVFRKLFVNGSPDEVRTQVQRLRQGGSILDAVHAEAQAFERDLGPRDRQKLDEYFTSVREVEQRLVKYQEWATKPKPKVDAKPPTDIPDAADTIGRARLMFNLIPLALQTDSTRFITMHIELHSLVVPIDGVKVDWHSLSHHGKDPNKLAQLKLVELEQMKVFGELLAKLKGSEEKGASVLDRTIVLFGSHMGNASSHDNKNMPIIVAGGGFKHGQHLSFDPSRNQPLCNLYVQILQRLGVEADAFASSTGTLTGFEAA